MTENPGRNQNAVRYNSCLDIFIHFTIMHNILMYICGALFSQRLEKIVSKDRFKRSLQWQFMVLHRTTFFLALSLLLLVPLLAPRTIWLIRSQKSEGIVAYKTMGDIGDQIRLSSNVIYFRHEKDTVWFNDMANLPLTPGERIPIRYRADHPSDARVDRFLALWGDLLVYGGLPLLLLIVIFLHPDLIPRRSMVRVGWKKPIIELV
jgi:hypothetical protein